MSRYRPGHGVALGSMCYLLNSSLLGRDASGWMLLLLIAFAGADLARISMDRRWFSLRILLVHAGVVTGFMAGGAMAAWLTHEPLAISLAMASGYDWFTLSSVLMGQALVQALADQPVMGAVLADLALDSEAATTLWP